MAGHLRAPDVGPRAAWPARLALLAVLSVGGAGGGCVDAARATPARGAATSAAPAAAPRPLAAADCAADDPVDVVDHAIDLALNFDPPSLAGSGDVRVRARRATDVVRLDARDLRVSAVAVAGRPLDFRAEGGRLCAKLPGPLAAGAELSLRLAWAAAVDRDTPRFFADQAWAGYLTSAWAPTLQDPAQRATLTLRLTTPPGTKATASGRSLGVSAGRDGRPTHTFVVDRPAPPFLFAFAAGRFDEAELDVDGVKLRALGPPGADLKGALELTAPMLRFLRDRTGAPFPAAEYRQAFVRGDAAQEAAGMSLLGAEALDDVRREPTEDWIFSHELAHQWFAWLVPCADFADFWLNEGFATFLVAAVKEQRWGREAYGREVELWRKRSAKVHAQGRDAPVSLAAPGAARRRVRDSDLQPRGVTYSRGALVLHKLRGELGDAAFWGGLRRYVADRAGRGATSADLRASFEAATGRDLGPFFARWVYAEAPDL